MIIHRAHLRQQGFSMLEVLIAVLVFSLGMMGLAGLLIFAIQSNHVAYLRTQATFLAHSMADRMGANSAGVWAGNYNITSILAPGTGVTTTCAAGCNPAELATHDIQAWSQQLNTFLPNAKGTITCGTAGLTYLPNAAQQDMRPPYGGRCTMTLTWNEAGGAGGAQQSSVDASLQGQKPQTYTWVFQP
jgi:type IV pilus assembly protein PilV